MPEERWAPGMESKHKFEAIDKPTFEWVLQHYSSLLSTAAQDEGDRLDKLRYKTIPDTVKARNQNPNLDKEGLVELVTWKLKHGTFRPALKTLVQQNDDAKVESTSHHGFTQFKEGNPKNAIKTLTELKGIGPATASLMLSVYDPAKAPFFSDELFRWAFYESGKGNGWDRRIKYTAKEYAELYDKVQQLLERLDVTAVDAEKVAYVLGKHDFSGASAKEDLGKSSKRKADEMSHGADVLTAERQTAATIGTREWHEAVNKGIREQSLPENLPPDNEEVDLTNAIAKQQSNDNAEGRPKRKSRKQ